MAEPRRSWLRRLLDRPDARPRVIRAVGELLGASLVSIAAIGALTIWHLVRRGRLIREGLGPPRVIRAGEFDEEPPTKSPRSDSA